MLTRFLMATGRFWHNERGNFAIIFGVAALPMVALAGAAMDYSRVSSAQSRLQSAADAGALAAASGIMPLDKRQHLAIAMIEANADGLSPQIDTTFNTHDIIIEAKAQISTPFLSMAGVPEMTATATVQVKTTQTLTGGKVAPGTGLTRTQLDQKRREFLRATARLPRNLRDRLNRQMEAEYVRLSKTVSTEGGDVRITK